MSGDIECSWNSDGFGETWMHGRKVYVLGKKDGYSKARKPTFKVEMIGKGKRRHVDPDGDISILKMIYEDGYKAGENQLLADSMASLLSRQ